MGTDISTRIERRHPQFGWVCSWHRLEEGRNYALFNLLREECFSGLPDDCNNCSRVFAEHYDTGTYWLSLAGLKAIAARRPMEDYEATEALVEMIKNLSKAKATARVQGDHEDTDADVRVIFGFWR